MTLEDLKGLRQGEVVVLTKVDEKITEYHNYQIGDELIFTEVLTDEHDRDVVNFIRRNGDKSQIDDPVIAHFSYEICDYIESKVLLERDKKLNELGI